MRKSEVERKTSETDINIKIDVDGTGRARIDTPNGFLNHMLELLAKHSGIDMDIRAKGDVEVDLHHTMEDVGIVLGEALCKALGDKKGIERYGSIMMPMDEVRCDVAIDLGGRANMVYSVDFPQGSYDKGEGFDYSLIKEFIKALSDNLKMNVHVHLFYGSNSHHIAEAIFKGLARALKQAVKITGEDVPSTKGII